MRLMSAADVFLLLSFSKVFPSALEFSWKATIWLLLLLGAASLWREKV
jgi:hypothetical protein